MGPTIAALRRRRGRPQKFGRSSRPVTVTLPEDVIARLATVHEDLGRAIVATVEGSRPPTSRTSPAEIVAFGGHAVIVVTPVKALRKIRGVELIPVDNNRALVSLTRPHSIPQLELDIRDLLESGTVTKPGRDALEGIAAILREARASRTFTLSERTIIVLEARRRR